MTTTNANSDRELALLTAWRPAEAGVDADVLQAVRQSLVDAGWEADESSPHRGRGALRIGAVAAAVIAALVVIPVLLGQHLPGGAASAEASELLNRAAGESITATDARLAPGQWLHVTTHGRYDAEDQRANFWVPADRNGDWYLSRDGLATVAVGGDFYGSGADGGWQSPTSAFLASLPRDVDQLRERLYADSKGQGPSPDGEAVVFVADILRSGIVPADLRSSLYRVLAGVRGVEVTNRQVALDGVVGVGIGRAEDGYLQELVIDPTTGQFVGERYIQGGDVEGLASTRYEVVNRVPTEVVQEASRTPWTPGVAADGVNGN